MIEMNDDMTWRTVYSTDVTNVHCTIKSTAVLNFLISRYPDVANRINYPNAD